MSRTIHATWDRKGRCGWAEQGRIERKSRPAGRIARIVANELLAHGSDDDSLGYWEAERLERLEEAMVYFLRAFDPECPNPYCDGLKGHEGYCFKV